MPPFVTDLALQASTNTSVKFKRRGWDFTMEAVLRWFHEDEGFRQAAEAAHPLDFKDRDGMAGSMYLHLLNQDCKRRLSKRKDAYGAGVYGVGMSAGHLSNVHAVPIATINTWALGMQVPTVETSSNCE